MTVIYFLEKRFEERFKKTEEYLNECLKDYFCMTGSNIDFASITLKRTDSGKPYIDPNGAEISVTHTNTLLLVAVSDACLGIDAERLDRTLRNSDSIVNKYFSVGEKNLYNNADPDDKKQVFLDIWVKKEAMVKFTGKGLSDPKNTDSCHAEGAFINIPYKDHVTYLYTKENNKSYVLKSMDFFIK